MSVDIAGRRIVGDIDIDVPDGRFVGLLGPNGSGKSTILKAVYRSIVPSSGRVLLDGADPLSMRAKKAARRVPVAQESDRRVRLHRVRNGDDRPDPAQAGLERDDDPTA